MEDCMKYSNNFITKSVSTAYQQQVENNLAALKQQSMAIENVTFSWKYFLPATGGSF